MLFNPFGDSGHWRKIRRDISIGAYGYMFEWFHRELQATFGVNVFDYPFDREKGYTIIREGQVEVLVLKLETMNKNYEIIKEFSGISEFKEEFENHNVGELKSYRYLYEGIKHEVDVPRTLLDFYYKNNPQFAHFYTKEEADAFYKRWIKN